MLLSAILAANRRKPAPAIDRSKAAVDPVAAFKLRCEARAHLYSEGELDLHEAVDVLEESARLSGLNRTISRDAVQAIMAEAFRTVREREWASENRTPDIEIPDETEASPSESRAPASTVDALLYKLRSGLSCLAEDGARGRLRRCDEAAMRTLAKELLTWPGKTKNGKDRPWLPAWSGEDVNKLIDIWQVIK